MTGRPASPRPSWTPWAMWTPRSRRNLATVAARALTGGPPLPLALARLLRRHPFLLQARDAQAPPMGDWRTWLLMGGRGAGKTRAGAEWVRYGVWQGLFGRIALVGPTFHDVREVMIEGPSGLIACEPQASMRPVWQPSRQRLEWPNGAVAHAFSAEDPDGLRGPQFDAAWADEAGAWARGEAAWDNLQLALRLGACPRALVTTTPRATPLMLRLAGSAPPPGLVITRTATADNAANLAPGFVPIVSAAYAGTALARQELHGELIHDPPGAMFARADIDRLRVSAAPYPLDDIVVAVDPAVSAGRDAHACGIVAAGVREGLGYVLGDVSAPGLKPLDWAARASALASLVGASHILAEANQGGEMVREVLKLAAPGLPVRLVTARIGKRGRAQPIAALYAQGRVCHVGVHPALEDELCRFGAADDGHGPSPDRADALIWALWALLVDAATPRITLLA